VSYEYDMNLGGFWEMGHRFPSSSVSPGQFPLVGQVEKPNCSIPDARHPSSPTVLSTTKQPSLPDPISNRIKLLLTKVGIPALTGSNDWTGLMPVGSLAFGGLVTH
jgi:hypothetical protein